MSPVVPLIGDYLFRAVAHQRQQVNEPVLEEADIIQSMKLKLSPEEKEQLEKKLAQALC